MKDLSSLEGKTVSRVEVLKGSSSGGAVAQSGSGCAIAVGSGGVAAHTVGGNVVVDGRVENKPCVKIWFEDGTCLEAVEAKVV